MRWMHSAPPTEACMSDNQAQKRKLHWFFSLGTVSRDATYFLTDGAATRFSSTFPHARPSWEPGAPILEDSLYKAKSTTAALLNLLGEPRGYEIVFQFFATSENTHKDHFGALVEEVPDWARAGIVESADAEKLDSRDPVTIRKVVERVVTEVADGDAVFFETTNGLRPFMTGFVLAQSVLRATRPSVEVIGAVYGELGIITQPPDSVPEAVRVLSYPKPDYAVLSPIYEHSELLDLPLWASAADDLRRRFDGAGLAELLRDDDAELAMHLGTVVSALDLGWPDDLQAPIEAAVARLPAPGAMTPGRAAVLDLARAGLHDLMVRLPGNDRLDRARLRFHLETARFMARNSRYGEAIRVLREAMVNWALLALTDEQELVDWRNMARRREAERALFRSKKTLNALWQRVCDLRNAASHARANQAHAEIDLAAFAKELDPDKGELIRGVEQLIASGGPAWLPAHASGGVTWYVQQGASLPEPAVQIAAERELAAFNPMVRVPLVLTPKTFVGAKADSSVIEVASGGIRGKSWIDKKWKKARGSSDAILMLEAQPGDQVLLASALSGEGIRPWALLAGQLWPLFDGSMVPNSSPPR